jgi:hypothetical protein
LLRLYISLVVEERISFKCWWNDTDREKNEVLGEKLVSMPLCPPQIPFGLAWG